MGAGGRAGRLAAPATRGAGRRAEPELTSPAQAPVARAGPGALRVLFFNEGNIGSHILGQGQLDGALRVGVGGCEGVQARFAGLPTLGRWTTAMVSRRLPALGPRDLDLLALRWHLVQSLRARRALERELRGWPADVVHLHTQSVALLSRALMRRLPFVLSVDTSVLDWSQMPAWATAGRLARSTLMPSRLLERRALRGAALIVAWTSWARHGVEREEPRAHVIAHHPGIDLELYRPAARHPRRLPRVLFVGGRFREKGGEELLGALAGRLGTEVEVDVVTPTEVAPRAGLRVHRLGPSDPALVELYQQADVLCLPTRGDTNPWVLLEAMACATPVISTRVGAIPELLDEGRAGVLVGHSDPRGLGEALGGLLGDPARRAELGAAGRARCEQRYDARRQFPLLAELMRRLRGRAPAA